MKGKLGIVMAATLAAFIGCARTEAVESEAVVQENVLPCREPTVIMADYGFSIRCGDVYYSNSYDTFGWSSSMEHGSPQSHQLWYDHGNNGLDYYAIVQNEEDVYFQSPVSEGNLKAYSLLYEMLKVDEVRAEWEQWLESQ